MGESDYHLAGRSNKAIYYDGIHVGTRLADFVVEGKLTIELKATIRLEDAHLAQAKSYIVAYNFEKASL